MTRFFRGFICEIWPSRRVYNTKPQKNLVIFVAHRHPGPLLPKHLAKFKRPGVIWPCMHDIVQISTHILPLWRDNSIAKEWSLKVCSPGRVVGHTSFCAKMDLAKGIYWIWYRTCPPQMWDMYQNVEYWFYTALKVPPGDLAVQCPCFLVFNSNGWADFLSNLVLPFGVLSPGFAQSRQYRVKFGGNMKVLRWHSK